MTRELIEAAKAVLEAAYYNVPHDVSTDQGAKRYAAFQRLYAAVRAAEAAPVADTVQKRIPSKTMSAYVLEDCGHIKNEHGHIRTLDAVPGRPFFEVSCGAGCMVVGLDAASVATAWDLVATKRSAMPYIAPAPVADAERVLEAAKAAVIAIPGFKNISALSQWAVGLVADAIRPYIAPAPVADTVAVPVAAIRRLKSTVSSFGVGVPEWARSARKAADEITKLLPPPPAPEPSVPGDVIDQWNREAVDYANEQFPEPPEVNRAARYGYVAARRAEWAKKGGG